MKRVAFNENIKFYIYEAEENDDDVASISEKLDKLRFQDKIKRIGKILSPVLQKKILYVKSLKIV